MKTLSEYDKLDFAFRSGQKARIKNKPLSSNPYSNIKGGRSQTEYSQWDRGWFSKSENQEMIKKTKKEILRDIDKSILKYLTEKTK